MSKKVSVRTNGEHSKNNRKRIVCLSVATILLILLLLLLFRCCSFDRGLPISPIISGDLPTEGELQMDNPDLIAPDYFNIRINATPILENSKLNLRLENPVHNRYACQVEISLQQYESISKTGDQLYLEQNGQTYQVQIEADTKSYRLKPLEAASEEYEMVELKDDTKTVYRSPIVQPGQSLEFCTFDASLPVGKYYAVAQYTISEPETGAVIGYSRVNLDIYSK